MTKVLVARVFDSQCIQVAAKQQKLSLPHTFGYREKRGNFVLRLVTLQVLIRWAPILTQISTISLLTLRCNLFKTTLNIKVYRMALTPRSVFRFLA